jgi:hypothetical protein
MAFVTSRAIGPRLYRDVIGHVLRLRAGIICVPYKYRGDGRWDAVVVGGGVEPYEPECWPISVHTEDVDEAERIEIA